MFVQKRGAMNRDYPKRTILFQSLSFLRGHLNFRGGAFCSSTLMPVFFSYLGRLLFFNSKKSPSKKHHLGSMTTYFNDGKKNSNKNMSQPPKRLKLNTSEVPMFKNYKRIVGMEPTCDPHYLSKMARNQFAKTKFTSLSTTYKVGSKHLKFPIFQSHVEPPRLEAPRRQTSQMWGKEIF